MADFCAECSIDTLGFNSGDMAGGTTADHTARGEFNAELCEGCGAMILVDHEGIRMTEIEPLTRVVDGKAQNFWSPRPDADVAAVRERIASLPAR